MLENIVPLWLYLQLTIVLFSFLYIIVTEKNKILKQIKSNKSLYVLLSIIIIVGFGIRIINIVHSEYIVVDNSDYILKGTIISETGRFLHGYTNAPLFASIISLFIKTVNYNPSLGSILSVMFGTLSILLAFIFVRLFLKNNIVAILTAIILCFSNLHYDASVNGGPLGLSVFFIFLTLVLLEYIVITKKKNYVILLGIISGLSAQIYYVELILVIPIILYIILNKIKIKYVIIFLGIIFVSVIPFSLYQYSEPHPPLVHKYYKPSGLNKIACFWFKDKCRFLTINKIESEFPAINSHESRFYSYFSYLFLGEGRGYSERKIIDGKVLAPITIFWNNAEIDNNVYKLYFLLSLFGLFHLRLHMKKFLLMFITFLSFFIVYGSYKWQIFIYMMQIESIVVIPLVAYGTYMIARRFPKNINLIFIIIITIILISPFFTQNHIRDYSDYSMFNKNNKQTILDWWSNPFCGVPLTEIEPYCKLIANKIKES